MDRQRLLNSLAMGLLIAGLFFVIQNYLHPRTTPPPTPTTLPAWSQPAGSESPINPPETWVLGSAVPGQPYKLELTVNNRTAGLDLVRLNGADYAQKIGTQEPLMLMEAADKAPRPLATLNLGVNDEVFTLGRNHITWKFIEKTPTQARLSLIIQSKTKENLVEVQKLFTLDPNGYQFHMSHQVKNLTDKPLQIWLSFQGPLQLPNDDVRSDSRAFRDEVYHSDGQYLDSAKQILAGSLHDGIPQTLGLAHGANRIAWIGSSNRFFSMILRPESRDGQVGTDKLQNGRLIPQIDYINQFDAQLLVPHSDNKELDVTGVSVQGRAFTLPAKAQSTLPVAVFAGPKQRQLLTGDPEAAPGTPAYDYYTYKYISIIQFSQGGPCGFCTFSWLAQLILRLLDAIHLITLGNYGLAIILLVLVVRLALHPLTRYGQVNMTLMQKRMAEVQPDMDRIKKRYTGKQQSDEIMKLYKERNINPAASMLGCLPMLLQTPIWLALYAGLAVDIDLRHARFIPGWINDLANPDTIYSFASPIHIPLLGAIHGINLLPLLLGLVFFFQMRVQSATMPQSTDPQQQQMQTMTKYSLLLFPLFLYSAPSGLNLYIFASTCGGLIDTYFIRRHIKAKGYK